MFFLKSIYKNLMFIFLLSIAMLISSCRSSLIVLNPELVDNNIKGKFFLKKTYVLYASDDPYWFPYFSIPFTQRIAKETAIEALHNLELNRFWLFNSIADKEKIHLEERFTKYSEHLKNLIDYKEFVKAEKLSREYMQSAAELLADNQMSVAFSYGNLAFWAAMAQIGYSDLRAKNFALIYEKYLTLRMKELLVLESEGEKIDHLTALAAPYLVKQYPVKIKASKHCVVFVNGQEVKTAVVMLPPTMPSVLSANCTHGTFHRTFSSDKISFIEVIPSFQFIFEAMPALSALPRQKLYDLNSSFVLLIYWSHAGKYIDSTFVETKKFSVIKKIRIPLRTEKDRQQAGDSLIRFINSIDIFYTNRQSMDLTSPAN